VSAYHQRITVALDYPVYFTDGVFNPENPHLVEAIRRKEPARKHRCFFAVEQRVAELWPELLPGIAAYLETHRAALELAAPPWVGEGGETSKNDLAAPARLHACFESAGLDRQSAVVVVGGGAFQDMVGYAAATAHRGLRVVRLPTTVLSQNDSGVGVKNGINAYGKKNFLGTFAAPFAVLSDARFLETLPHRDRIAGMAEAVKVACIRDAEFFAWLTAHGEKLAQFERDSAKELIRRCAVLHLEHIARSGDAFELGTARPLDFGHWAAHKLETMTDFRLRHGEAVAIGIALDTRYSAEVGLIGAEDAAAVSSLLGSIGLPRWDDALAMQDSGGRLRVLDGLREFREHLGGELTVTLLEGIGRGREVHSLDEAAIVRSIEWLAQTKALDPGVSSRA
jgi:3-dehydroquinate synthase